MRVAKPMQERLAEKYTVEPNTGCWLWTAMLNHAGYGILGVSVANKTTPKLAHRLSYETHVGPIPEGMYVCHRCDQPSCVNPAHLFVGTQQANMADMLAEGRSSAGKSFAGRRGENHGMAKLDWGKVDEIRAKYAAGGVSQRDLGAEYGVAHRTIGLIVRGSLWTEEKRPA